MSIPTIRKSIVALLSVFCLILTHQQVAFAQVTGDRGKPNIIVIMSDDMGYSDIGCYGSEIETPVLDALAANGLRFTQFYNTGRCCPTRASLLTGLYPHQTGIGWMIGDQKLDGYRGDLNRNCVTIAEALKPTGYSTSCVGKWHVTVYQSEIRSRKSQLAPATRVRPLLRDHQRGKQSLGSQFARSRQPVDDLRQ